MHKREIESPLQELGILLSAAHHTHTHFKSISKVRRVCIARLAPIRICHVHILIRLTFGIFSKINIHISSRLKEEKRNVTL